MPSSRHCRAWSWIWCAPPVSEGVRPRGGLLRAVALAGLVAVALLRPAWAETRAALIIGNAAYTGVPELVNPVNDARDIAAALETLEFEVSLGLDLGLAEMDALMESFVESAAEADVVLFFYAGHGFQAGARNFLVPVDAELTDARDFLAQVMPLDETLARLERTQGIRLIFLDACRDNPLGADATEDGLARVGSAADFLFAFATQPDNVAYDGLGRNSYFTEALLSRIHTPGQDISELMIGVRRDVLSATGGRQIPWENSSLTRQFRFVSEGETVSPETMLWQVASRAEDPVLMQLYLERFPDGAHVADVREFFRSTADGTGGDSSGRRLPAAEAADGAGDRLWALARRTRMRPLVERYLTLHPDGPHVAEARALLDSLPAPDAVAPTRRCQELATHPRDATANVAGVSFEALVRQAPEAVAACRAAHETHPDVPHYAALLARAMAASGDIDAALTLFRMAADAGDLRAKVSLAQLYEAGQGVARDPDQAIALYEAAAAAGSPDAAVNLGVALFEGRGVLRDAARAVALFEQAAASGSPFATFNLGVLVDRGVAQTGDGAAELFLRAARAGEPRGWRAAAALVDEGRGVDRDPQRAADLLLQAVASDDGTALAELSRPTPPWSAQTLAALEARLAESGFLEAAPAADADTRAEALRLWRNGGYLLSALN